MKKYFENILFLVICIFGLLFNNFVFAEEIVPDVLPEEVPIELSNTEIQTPPAPQEEDAVPENDVTNDTYIEENVFIRSGEKIIYDGVISLPVSAIVNIEDSGGASHEVKGQSVLALIDFISKTENPPFMISNLEYYSSFGAFYLKCITPTGGEELCDNWQYVVNGSTPSSGIDQTTLSGGENVALYFGNPHKLTLSNNESEINQPVTVSSLKYNYLTDTWDVLTGVNIDVTIPNANDPWNPTVVLEVPVDENGQTIISLANQGTYTIGIKEDFSFPSYQVVVNKEDITSGGNSGGSNNNNETFSLNNAISFLSTSQLIDGSFVEDLYTDWVAIGLAKLDIEDTKIKKNLKNYLKNNDLGSSSVTENERRAMALMSLGIDPRNGAEENYIQNIISSFDDEQIGDEDLANDDIFALIVLAHAGYSKDDEMIKKIVSFIVSNQSSDGSWGSVDMTSAAIQALRNFEDVEGASSTILSGEEYLLDKQSSDGGFGNVYSTSWAVQALSLNNSLEDQTNRAIDYLKDSQGEDGALDTGDLQSKIWATAYALPAIQKLSWNDILDNFSKEEEEENVNSTIDEENQNNLEDENILVNNQTVPEEKMIITEIPKEEVKNIKPLKLVTKINQTDEVKNEETENTEKNLLEASVYDASSGGQTRGFLKVILEFWIRLWNTLVHVFI